ncbi:hypothetical protein HGRIS_013831 [Hohenbuehelia grisea]|uniref:Kinase n=1 Tax=Hohenbuehelia grisea TaxID=104357 RepID=A0ABR3IWU0_9AGAR
MSSEAPHVTSSIPLTTQVGGHAGVQTSEDGSLLIKPALPLELQFYQITTSNTAFEPLRLFLPKFYGTLKLEGKVEESTSTGTGGVIISPVQQGGESKESLVLENLSHPFSKPNIIDIKLGTVLYDESASPDKVERMLKTARETTSLETGVRLTGFQVYDNTTGKAVNTPKSYGKSIKPADLPDGIARFFPVASSTSTSASQPSETETADSTAPGSSGLPRQTLLPMLRYIREDVAELKDALAQIELRMVGGSVLIVYEADWERAVEGLKAIEEGVDEEDGDDDDDDESDTAKKPSPPYVVKLIDFAHTRLVPGQGPDEGILLGLKTVLRLIDGRIEQLDALSE